MQISPLLMRTSMTVVFLTALLGTACADRTQKTPMPDDMMGFYEDFSSQGFSYGKKCNSRDGAGGGNLRLGITKKDIIRVIPSGATHYPISGVYTESSEARDEVMVVYAVDRRTSIREVFQLHRAQASDDFSEILVVVEMRSLLTTVYFKCVGP